MRVIPHKEYNRKFGSNIVTLANGERELAEEWDYEPEIVPEFLEEDSEILRRKMSLINVTPSQFTEFAVQVPNKKSQKTIPFSFSDRRYLRLPYDTPAKRVLLKCGRQVEKSTLLGNRCLAYCCIINNFSVLYVSPTNLQTKRFSADRLKEPIVLSPLLGAWTTSKLNDSVFEKQFVNHSKITLRYAFLNADRVRGVSADLILLDEVQDIITDNIPVIEAAASHSQYKIFLYSGTPKSTDNAIEQYWTEQSTQNEWVVPCDRHGPVGGGAGRYWNILGEANIGPEGLICDKCGGTIQSMHPDSQWASMNASVKDKLSQPFDGYRIPQLMVPWVDWKVDILDKQKTNSRDRFFNEVLGMSYDSGTRPLTPQDVIDCCIPGLMMDESTLRDIRSKVGASTPVFCGIDWGCHDDQTRILTERGFVYFKDLTDQDKVAQWDPDTREMTFTLPQVRTVKNWDKPLHHFKGKGLDMMLTHTHRMRVGARSGGQRTWVTEPCEKTVQRGASVLFAGYVDWKGQEQEWFTLPGQPVSPGYQGSSPGMFRMDDWLEFLGYYLSEGGLCYNGERPSCLKMSQRETVNPGSAKKIGDLLHRLFGGDLSTFPNPKTGDLNWTLYGKQLWKWVQDNVGAHGNVKRIPREFLGLSQRQLRILFDAMMLGDGNTDTRPGNNNGYYGSTSRGLCEDFQELCIRLGLRSTLSLHKPEEKNRRARWRVSWSTGRDFQYNDPRLTESVPYEGKVYCCKVPTGYIVTERNGCIAYQGNTGEGSYTVLTLGTYINNFFTIFYAHRFEGQETEPPIQLEIIGKIIRDFNVSLVGVDYGGGFDRNDALQRKFGREKIYKYQYSMPSQKVRWEPDLKRFLVHRTEVMSDMFNAIRRGNVIRFPDWDQFQDPFGKDMLNIFSEYNEQMRQIQYKKSPNCTDDSFHSILLCLLASMIRVPRLDILNPTSKTGSPSED